MKKRPQVTINEVIKFLQAYSGDLPIFCSESDFSEEEPYEFIHDEGKRPCVAIDITTPSTGEGYVIFGYANEDSNSQP